MLTLLESVLAQYTTEKVLIGEVFNKLNCIMNSKFED